MDRRILFFASLLLLAGVSELWADTKKEPVSYVNPMIGTSGMGHTFPGACAPFGIVQLSPETDTIPQNIDGRYVGKVYAYCAGYQHDDPTIVVATAHPAKFESIVEPIVGKTIAIPRSLFDIMHKESRSTEIAVDYHLLFS